ncbi:MAG TPA: hypothetical protein VF284_11950 [Rhodanobacteraceae bacterium]
MLATIAAWCLAFAGYLLFAGSLGNNELETGIVLASGTAAWVILIRRCGRRHFAFAFQHAIVWLKTLGAAVPATVRVLGVLARTAILGGSPGRGFEVPFLRGGEKAQRACARRANAVLTASFAPDRFIVRAEPGQEKVRVHAIVASAQQRDPRWLT